STPVHIELLNRRRATAIDQSSLEGNTMSTLRPFDLFLFGGSGDLAMRKLLPALYYRHRAGDFPEHGRIIGIARQAISREEYIAHVKENCSKFVPSEDFTAEV